MTDRKPEIIEYISSHGKTEVSTLAGYLNASEVTIRKDLDILSERGILRRERGFALLNETDPIMYKMAFRYKDKCRIAETAARFVQNGETILIDTGSTCALFAEKLAKSGKDLTVITNSVFNIDFLKNCPGIQFVLLGGNYQKKSHATVGPMTVSCLQNLKADRIFVGTDGFSLEGGFTADDLIRSQTLGEMIRKANRTYVLMDSTKFSKKGTVSFLPFSDVDTVITDSSIPESDQKFLSGSGIEVVIAK